MTKEELEKEAYKETEKLKEYQTEPNNEYEKGFNNGEVRGCKDGYRDGAEPREKRIAELEDRNAVLEKRIERAKECIKKLLFIINSDPANYNCKGLVQDAENFIYNRTCNIRQQGEHCISETRCIMCDK